MKTNSLLTDISSFSILQTCSCSTCTCSNNFQVKIQSNYWKNHANCLTSIFIILYENLIWCLQIIYELFFKSFWQIFIYIKQDFQYNDNKISINNSARTNYSSLFEACHRPSIDRNIVLISVRSSYCQTEILRNYEICCKQNQTSFISNVSSSTKKIPADHSKRMSSNEEILPEYSTNKFSLSNSQQRKLSENKFKQKQPMISYNNIPLALATSLHSNVSSYNTDYFLKKYVHHLFTNKNHLR